MGVDWMPGPIVATAFLAVALGCTAAASARLGRRIGQQVVAAAAKDEAAATTAAAQQEKGTDDADELEDRKDDPERCCGLTRTDKIVFSYVVRVTLLVIALPV